MPAWKDASLDKVARLAVARVSVVRDGDDLNRREPARFEVARDALKVLPEKLVADRLEHFDAHHLVEGPFHLAVVAEDDVDEMIEPGSLDARASLLELLARDCDARHLDAKPRRHSDSARAPSAPDFEHVLALLELRLVEEAVNLGELRRLKRRLLLRGREGTECSTRRVVGRRVHPARVHHRIVEEGFVKVVSGVVMVANVAHRVGLRVVVTPVSVVKHPFANGAERSSAEREDISTSSRGRRRRVGVERETEHFEQADEVARVPHACDVCLAEPDVGFQNHLCKHFGVEHAEPRVRTSARGVPESHLASARKNHADARPGCEHSTRLRRTPEQRDRHLL
mmetsp:Transcript_12673/g.41765  ORF Transcript_12673/g.41765 Transcript_12673/m.41765 type:complete len:341 (+) Transcript_12673:1197-2219(+)